MKDMKEQVLQVTKGDFVGSASGAVVLTALIVFFIKCISIIEVLNQTKKGRRMRDMNSEQVFQVTKNRFIRILRWSGNINIIYSIPCKCISMRYINTIIQKK